jgi:hypothetical protein
MLPIERVDPHALHDPIDDSIRAGIVLIQPRQQAHVISQQLRPNNLERGAQRIVQVRRNRRNHRIEVPLAITGLRDTG